MVESFWLLGSIINNRGSSTQEISHRVALGSTRMKVLEKIFKCNNMDLQTKDQAVVFNVVLYGSESWTTNMPLNFEKTF